MRNERDGGTSALIGHKPRINRHFMDKIAAFLRKYGCALMGSVL
jgi:hypothetical protein